MPTSKRTDDLFLVPGAPDKGGIISLASKTLGQNYLIPADLENPRYQWLTLIDEGNKVMGFSSYSFRGNIGTIVDVAVHPDIQGNGWGSYLVAVTLEALSLLPIDTVKCPAWETSKGIHLGKALEKNGFNKQERVPRSPENAREDFSCPVCGTPCNCYMVIYERSINNPYGHL